MKSALYFRMYHNRESLFIYLSTLNFNKQRDKMSGRGAVPALIGRGTPPTNTAR